MCQPTFRILAPSLTSFFAKLSDDVQRGHRSIDPESGVSCFGRTVSAETDGIKVSVAVAPCGALSRYPEILFVYKLTIEGAETVTPCRLTTRHWRIVDGRGVQSAVNGPGVIGQFPVVSPGSSFSYTSCCPMADLPGTMQGFLKFRVLQSEREIEATVPTFTFERFEMVSFDQRK